MAEEKTKTPAPITAASTVPEPGMVDPTNAARTGSPASDPTQQGIRRDTTPLQTRSMGDATAGVSDADMALAAGAQESRRKGRASGDKRDDGAPGGAGMREFVVDDLTDEAAKSLLLSYGVDAPAAQAKEVLQATIERAKRAGSKMI